MQYLPLLSAILVGSLVVGGFGLLFLRARARERLEPGPAASPSVAQEVQAIGRQIEQSMAEQRLQGETQRQLLAQKLDSVRQSVDSQRSHVDGLQNELRHEVRRRDAEMEEIRSQLGSLQSAVALPPAGRPLALPPALPDAPPSTAEVWSEAPADGLQLVPEPPEPARPAEPDAPEVAVTSEFQPRTEESGPAPRAFDLVLGGPSPSLDPFAQAPSGDSAPTDHAPSLAAADAPGAQDPAEPNDAEAHAVPGQGEPGAEAPDATGPGDSEEEAPPAGWHPEDPETVDAPPAPAASGPSPDELPSGDEMPDAAAPGDVAQEGPSADDALSEDYAPAFKAFSPAELVSEAPPSEAPRAGGPPAERDQPELPPFEAPALDSQTEPASSAPAPLAEPAAEEPAATPAPSLFEDVSFEEVSFDDLSFGGRASWASTFEGRAEPAADGPSQGSPGDAPWIARPDRPSAPGPFGPPPVLEIPGDQPPTAPEHAAGTHEAPAWSPAEGEAPPAVPEDADDLTVIRSIDGDVQRRLYAQGVTSLEEIAQWNPTRARQIATQVQVSEEAIMNQWVFEAQAALFNRFVGQAGA